MALGSLLFSFQGRINRAKYWLAQLIAWAITTVLLLLVFTAFVDSQAAMIVGMLAGFCGALISSIAVGVKRAHDRDKSGWWLVVFYLVPFWWIIELGCLRGTIGPNRYGPDPLGATAAEPA